MGSQKSNLPPHKNKNLMKKTPQTSIPQRCLQSYAFFAKNRPFSSKKFGFSLNSFQILYGYCHSGERPMREESGFIK